MRIRVHGNPQNTTSREVCRFIRFCASVLMTPAMIEKVSIRVDFGATRGFKASAEWVDGPERPKRFRIRIRETMSREEILCSLAHEMVHVKQYSSGQLRDYVNLDNFVRWESNRWTFEDEDSEDYWLAPWELEARGYERGLFKLFDRK